MSRAAAGEGAGVCFASNISSQVQVKEPLVKGPHARCEGKVGLFASEFQGGAVERQEKNRPLVGALETQCENQNSSSVLPANGGQVFAAQ